MNRKLFMLWLYRIGIFLAVCTGIYIAVSAIGVKNHETPIVLPESIKISCTTTANKVPIGHKVSILTKFSPEGAKAGLEYSSSDPDIVSIDKKGKATAHSFGSAIITVTTTDGTNLSKKIKLSTCIPSPQNLKVVCSRDESLDAFLTWDVVDGAIGYKVYRLTDEDEWKCLTPQAITQTNFTDNYTMIQADNTYAIMSIAEDELHNSEMCEGVTMTIPQAPYGTKISAITDAGIEYYWKKPSDVSGYEIYRSYEREGTYIFLQDISTRKTNTYVDSAFDRDQKFVYYKIRSYSIDENKNKVFSEMSDIGTARYRETLTLNDKKAFVRSGSTHVIKAYLGWGYANGVEWTSSNDAVATVSKNGVVSGRAAGTCEISCTLKVGEETYTKRCIVIVDRQPLEKIVEVPMRYTMDQNGMWSNPNAVESQTAKIVMAGDMMCTGSQQALQGYDTGDYNFNGSYSRVRNIIRDSDFAIGNLETSLSSTWPYMHESAYIDNYPNCNGPSRYLDAVTYAGFDAVVMANNHNCDAEVQGLKETVEQVERYNLAHTGAFQDENDQRYMLVNVNGIKIAYISYVSQETGFNGKEEEWLPEEVNTNLNYYEEEKVREDIKAARKAGAEYVIAFMHWGVKNVQSITNDQKRTAKELANLGVDYIVGSHSHLVQEYTVIKADDGRKVPCMYSLGDFQASIAQIPGNRSSVILNLELARDEDGNVVISDEYYIQCFTLTKFRGGYYVTIPTNLKNERGEYILKSYQMIHDRTAQSVGNKLREDTTEFDGIL